MKINYSGNEIRISQEKVFEKLLSRFKMTEAKPIKTPLGKNEKLTKEECALEGKTEQENMKKVNIKKLLLNYLASQVDPTFALQQTF